jgi:hypothetical protein
MLANSVVALDHFEKEIGARLVLEGPLTGKGYSKAALATAGNLATQKARLIDKLLPLLSLDEPRTASAPNLDHLTDEDVAAITAILDGAAARAENPEPEPPPAVHLRIELPSEDPS